MLTIGFDVVSIILWKSGELMLLFLERNGYCRSAMVMMLLFVIAHRGCWMLDGLDGGCKTRVKISFSISFDG